MFRKIVPEYKKFTEYSIYLFVILIILDVISTYIRIRYFNAYEANAKTARLFEIFGLLLPSILKIIMTLMLCHIIRTVWRQADSLLSHTNKWLNSLGIISSLNIMFVIVSLNVVYFIIVIHNINVLYNHI
ncbi:Uncharacterised protein [uncultured archaeon]|nr:Uncharacterised protein [uncultured archaeon]